MSEKCSQENCEAEAKWSYVWPGREGREYSCSKHMSTAKAVSKAMGFCLGDVRQEQGGE